MSCFYMVFHFQIFQKVKLKKSIFQNRLKIKELHNYHNEVKVFLKQINKKMFFQKIKKNKKNKNQEKEHIQNLRKNKINLNEEFKKNKINTKYQQKNQNNPN